MQVIVCSPVDEEDALTEIHAREIFDHAPAAKGISTDHYWAFNPHGNMRKRVSQIRGEMEIVELDPVEEIVDNLYVAEEVVGAAANDVKVGMAEIENQGQLCDKRDESTTSERPRRKIRQPLRFVE
jgi:hypothetical protein